MKRYLLTVASLLTLLFGACQSVEPETEVRTQAFEIPTSYRLEVDTFNGTILINESDNGRLTVTATIRQPKELEYEARVEGDTVKIVATAIRTNINPSPGVSLEISAPPNAILDLVSSNGWVEVVGVGTTGGIETSNGGITLANVGGLFVLNTSNGGVTLHDVEGSFGVETSNGRIRFDGKLDPDTNTQLRTSNGGIEFIVGEQANVEIDAETSNGDVEVAYPLSNASITEKKVVGTLGNGSSKVRLRTSNGGIEIR